jgi:tetratricopeptide (TPR) repeat protein
MPASSNKPRRRLIALSLAALLLAGAAIGLAWWLSRERVEHQPLHRGLPTAKADEVLRINNEGAAYMEQYDYAKAEERFAEVIKLAPNWIPGRINLAISLLNQHTSKEKVDEAARILSEVLKEDPKQPYANFCLGIIAEDNGRQEEAVGYYTKVTDIDPNDASGWYRLGNMFVQVGETEKAEKCLRRALSLDPYLQSASYQLGMLLRQTDIKKAKDLMAESEALKNQDWFEPTGMKYSEMGHYAEIINPRGGTTRANFGRMPVFRRFPDLKVDLHAGARWATSSDFGVGAIAELRKRIRARFGGVQVVLDYNQDGKEDLLFLSAVVEQGKVRDLLLRNDGHGHFTDVTHEAGLATPRPSLGCCVADFDNDGYPDLIITGAGEQHLFRNTGKGGFEEVSKAAALEKLNTVCLGASFLDLDQDGDLDLAICQYADSAEAALKFLDGPTDQTPTGELVVYLNIGEAPPHRPNEDPPLKTRFQRAKGPPQLLGQPCPATAVAFLDLDNDKDLDLVVLADGLAPQAVLNDRLLRFHRQDLSPDLASVGRYNGALAIDVDQDGRSDLLLIPVGASPRLLLNRSGESGHGRNLKFEKGVANGPPLMQAQAIDLDFDGWPDIVGLSSEHKPIVLQNQGGLLSAIPWNQLRGDEFKTDVISVIAADFGGDGSPGLMTWSESHGLEFFAAEKNLNHGLAIRLVGHRAADPSSGGEARRCNSDGIGTRVIAQADDRLVYMENCTQSASLGQSSMPLLLGLGPHNRPDIVRFRWPDNVPQAEFNLQAGHLSAVEERNRKPGSCPVIFTWNGDRFVYVTDFIGAGNLGELQPDHTCRQPRPEESVKIEADQLVPCDGKLFLKFAQPMQEVVYLDWLELFAVDNPQEIQVYPDERFSSGAPSSQDLFAFRDRIFPRTARDEKGRDLTQVLRHRDRDMADGFDRRNWYGFAGAHWIEMDFGDRLAALKKDDPIFLCTFGWTNYPYPDSIWAAAQAGIPMQPPILERQMPDRTWSPIVADAGFPAGQPRMSTLDVTGKLTGPSCKIRLRTNMQVFYDQIFLAPLVDRMPAQLLAGTRMKTGSFKVSRLKLCDATLESHGCALEFTPDGRQPTLYDYERLDASPAMRLEGCMTRLGDVTELLRSFDDCHVIFGPGEEVSARFDARDLPPLPKGWKRSFVLRAAGYTKDNGPFSATGSTIEPLPFKNMTRYPYGPEEIYPTDESHQRYRKMYNTRYMGPDDDARRDRFSSGAVFEEKRFDPSQPSNRASARR